MRQSFLLIALLFYTYAFGQEFFEYKCPDGQKLTFKTTSSSTVEVTKSIKKPYDYTYIVIPSEITIKGTNYIVTSIGGAFEDYTWLKGIEMPNTIETIGDLTFKGCTGLTYITIPESVQVIGRWAFSNCTKLKNIIIPNSVVEIKDFAFEGCTTLKSVKLSGSVMIIGQAAFRYCGRLTDFQGLRPNIKLGSDVFTASGFSVDSNEKKENDFEQMAQKYIIPRLKEWQQKREFETTAQYQSRVTKENQDKKTQELMKEAIKEYTNKNRITPKLGSYDADYQLYTIDSNYGKQYVKVPIDDAPFFKNRFGQATIDGTYAVTSNGLKLTGLTVSVGGKQYQSIKMNEDISQSSVKIDMPDINLPIASVDNLSPQPANTITDKSLDTEIPTTSIINSNTFVVIIGNEKYQKVAEVPYANNDALIFAAYCSKTLGIPMQNIRQYNNVTFGTMLAAMTDIKSIAEAYEGNLNVIFYYAGHGIPNETSHDAYLLPVDADGKLTEVCYPISRLYKELGDLGANNVFIFMDACFSGAQRGEGMLMTARGVAIKSRSQVPNGNLVVFSAATGDETAYPYKEKGHGLFTYFLLKKLQETQGECTLGELEEYVRQNVRQQSILVNRKSQTPTIQPSLKLAEDWKNIKLK